MSLTSLKNIFQKLSGFSSKYEELFNRANSSLIDMNDLFSEIHVLQENLEVNPNRLEVVDAKLKMIHVLMQKHVVSDVSELITIKNQLEEKVAVTENLDETIQKKQSEIVSKETELNTISKGIHTNRSEVIPQLKKELETILVDLGMPNAQFNIDVVISDTFYANGKDELSFLFSANKGGSFNELKKAFTEVRRAAKSSFRGDFCNASLLVV